MNIQRLLLPLVAAVCTVAATPTLKAQNPTIAVVDMQQALNDYNRTKTEVDKINAYGEQKGEELDAKKAVLKQLTDKMVEEQKIATDPANNEATRKAAAEKLQELGKERNVKLKEIAEDERKASQELMKLRQEMEKALVADIQNVMNQLAEAKKIDLIFDKSFLPKANKAIIYTSGNVVDLTAEIIGVLNQ